MSDPLSQIRMRDLMLLEHVHTLGTLRLAAQALHVTQPAITQTLKGLERAFGIALVERGRRGVSLTAAGQAALTRLRCARQEIEQARDAALSVMRPVLRVGATPIASLNLLPLAIGRMRLRMPAARLMLTEAGVASLWQQLSDGGLDALIGRMPAQDSKDAAHGSLRHETIGAERMVVVGRREHPMARPTARRRDRRAWLRSLAASAWVLPPGDALSVLNFNERFSQAGLLPPVPTVVSGSFYASLNMVAKAELLCVVPETAALALKQSLRLSILDVPWLNPPVDIVFAARVSAWDTQALAELRACFG